MNQRYDSSNLSSFLKNQDQTRNVAQKDTFQSKTVNMRSKIAQAILNDRHGDVDEPQQITTTLSAGVSEDPISIPSTDSATVAESALIRACQAGSSRANTRAEFTKQKFERNLEAEFKKQASRNRASQPQNLTQNMTLPQPHRGGIEPIKVSKGAMSLLNEAKIVYGSP